MKVEIDELSPVQRKVRVALPVETVANEFSRAYKNLGQRVRVKGFRTGKIPRSVLQGIYGEDVISEVRSHLVEESLGEVIKERGLQIVSRPEVESQDLRAGSEFAFSAVFEVKPDIELKDDLGVEVEKPRISVTEDQVDDALRRLQESHASLAAVEDRDMVQSGDFAVLDYSGTLAGEPLAGARGENYMLEVGAGKALPQFEEAVIGLQLGASRTVRVGYPANHPNKDLAGKTVDFSITVREIKRKVLPALDDEFAKDHGEHGSLEELKAAIRGRLEAELQRYQEEQLKEQILSRLLDLHSFAIPPSMVDRQTRYLMERYQEQMEGQTGADAQETPPLEEARKNLESRAARQVQATLLVERIAQREKIEVSDKEIQDRIEKVARAAGDRAKNVREYYSQPSVREDLRAQMVFDQTLNFLLGRATLKEVDAASSHG
jgi:trigger factor